MLERHRVAQLTQASAYLDHTKTLVHAGTPGHDTVYGLLFAEFCNSIVTKASRVTAADLARTWVAPAYRSSHNQHAPW